MIIILHDSYNLFSQNMCQNHIENDTSQNGIQ